MLEDYWPAASRRSGEEGTVIAAIRISAAGCVTGMSVVGSSGSDLLDAAVLKYLESASFTPGESGGKPMESTVMMPIVFKMSNSLAPTQVPIVAHTPVKTSARFDPNHPIVFAQKDYPKQSVRAHEEGVCVATMTAKADGTIQDPSIKRSTGYPRLDQVCLKLLTDVAHVPVCIPATEDGKAVDSSVEVPITFKINKGAVATTKSNNNYDEMLRLYYPPPSHY